LRGRLQNFGEIFIFNRTEFSRFLRNRLSPLIGGYCSIFKDPFTNRAAKFIIQFVTSNRIRRF